MTTRRGFFAQFAALLLTGKAIPALLAKLRPKPRDAFLVSMDFPYQHVVMKRPPPCDGCNVPFDRVRLENTTGGRLCPDCFRLGRRLFGGSAKITMRDVYRLRRVVNRRNRAKRLRHREVRRGVVRVVTDQYDRTWYGT